MRFGIVVVDSTQRGIPKSSALWYRKVIRANGLDVEEEPTPAVPPD